MVNNYICKNLNGRKCLVTFDERLSQIRILEKGKKILFLNIIEEYDGGAW
jgi:hypothetical protein